MGWDRKDVLAVRMPPTPTRLSQAPMPERFKNKPSILIIIKGEDRILRSIRETVGFSPVSVVNIAITG